jgi:hypothetical protein
MTTTLNTSMFMVILIGFAVGTARAEDVRINAATDCHPQIEVNAWVHDDHDQMSAVWRTANGLQAILPTQPHSAGTADARATWIRCSVPSSSSFSHTGIIRVKVYGDIFSDYYGFSRLIKLCSTNVYTGAYSCGAPAFMDYSGSFYKQLLPGNEWSNPAALPQVVIRLYYQDYVRGIVFSDE